MHGGSTPKGQRNALKHGIYSSALHDDEKEIWHELPLGSLDDEIKLARLQLLRAMRAQKAVDDARSPEGGIEDASNLVGMELAEIKEAPASTEGGVAARTITRKRPDYQDVIYRLMGRIADLESKRAEFLGGTSNENPREFARQSKEALDEIEASVPAPASPAKP